MSIATQYQQHLSEAARGALLSVVANHPTTSVAELRELVQGHPSLGEVTLAELLGSQGGSQVGRGRREAGEQAGKSARTAPVSKSNLNGKATTGKPAQGSWETRTEAGRTALDRAVLESLSALGGVGVSAEQIRAQLGATPAQVRTSLNRQIDAGEVSFSGKARGTRYTLET